MNTVVICIYLTAALSTLAFFVQWKYKRLATGFTHFVFSAASFGMNAIAKQVWASESLVYLLGEIDRDATTQPRAIVLANALERGFNLLWTALPERAFYRAVAKDAQCDQQGHAVTLWLNRFVYRTSSWLMIVPPPTLRAATLEYPLRACGLMFVLYGVVYAGLLAWARPFGLLTSAMAVPYLATAMLPAAASAIFAISLSRLMLNGISGVILAALTTGLVVAAFTCVDVFTSATMIPAVSLIRALPGPQLAGVAAVGSMAFLLFSGAGLCAYRRGIRDFGTL